MANWGVAVLLATGAAIALALGRPAGRRVHPALLLAPIWIGSVVCAGRGHPVDRRPAMTTPPTGPRC